MIKPFNTSFLIDGQRDFFAYACFGTFAEKEGNFQFSSIETNGSNRRDKNVLRAVYTRFKVI